MIEVDRKQAALVGQALMRVKVRPDKFVVPAVTPHERWREANLWFFLVGICQSTRTLQGTLGGRWLRGWDYLSAAARRALEEDEEAFTAARLVRITPDDLRGIFSDSGDPGSSTLDRIDERVGQLHDASKMLLEQYDGDAMQLYEAAGRRLCGDGGILERLSACSAYSDPVQKKSFLLLMYNTRCGAWKIHDLDNLKVAVDYHIMRIALRSGMVRVTDERLDQRLKAKEPVDAATDDLVRDAIRRACDVVVAASGQSVFDIDSILWMIGRNCCFYDHDPICGDNACWRRDVCSLLGGIAYDCPDHCALDGVCRGSRDGAYRVYWETTLNTSYY